MNSNPKLSLATRARSFSSRMLRRLRWWKLGVAERFSNEAAEAPHYVRDYRKSAKREIANKGHAQAMIDGIGGEYEAIGKIEAAILKHFGLKGGDLIVDVGCGSGRLARHLGNIPNLRYHGTDVVPQFLEHARSQSPASFRYTLVDSLKIPEADGAVDMVTMFSVATHLIQHEIYLLFEEAARVLKPGGLLIVSFFEIDNPHHWAQFQIAVNASREKYFAPLLAFIEESSIRRFAERLGLSVEGVYHGGTPFCPIDEPITFENGATVTGLAELGQSVAVLRKPGA